MKVTNLQAGAPRVVPAAAVVAAPEAVFVEDADERRLQLRELTILEENDVIIAAGSHGDNIRTLNRVLLAARVAGITHKGDEDPIGMPIPKTEDQYREMMLLVGRAGINAVADYLSPDDDKAKTQKAKN